jgi:hypothetical protein
MLEMEQIRLFTFHEQEDTLDLAIFSFIHLVNLSSRSRIFYFKQGNRQLHTQSWGTPPSIKLKTLWNINEEIY